MNTSFQVSLLYVALFCAETWSV